MHPIEHLRYVARATGADATLLTQEAASALSVFARDPHALLTGARSLLAKQAAVGPVWWMCSRLLVDSDARDAARHITRELQDDPTPGALDEAIVDGATIVISGWPDVTLHALVDRPDLQVLVIDVEGQGHSTVRRLDRHDVDAPREIGHGVQVVRGSTGPRSAWRRSSSRPSWLRWTSSGPSAKRSSRAVAYIAASP